MTLDMIKGMYLIPANLNKLRIYQDEIFNYYYGDLPSPTPFPQEIRLWNGLWSGKTALPTTLSESLQYLSNVSNLLITSVTSAPMERANSVLAFVKTDSRSTMTQDGFNALVLIFYLSRY